jgi:hypothetical protein
VNGWLEDGTSVELTPEQERIVNGVIQWHLDGTPFLLPRTGRAGGKTTIMATVAQYLGQSQRPADIRGE